MSAASVFDALLTLSSQIQPNYQAMLHVGSVRQTVRGLRPFLWPVSRVTQDRLQVKILSIDKSKALRTGDRATVRFEFIKAPEFLRESQRFLFRECVA